MYTRYTWSPPARASVAVSGSDDRFPVRRIFCVGRNYADHVREMGGDPKSDPPVYFTKPADAIVASGATVAYPPRTANLHHEVELVVALRQRWQRHRRPSRRWRRCSATPWATT